MKRLVLFAVAAQREGHCMRPSHICKRVRLIGALALSLAAASGPALTMGCGDSSGPNSSCCKVCRDGKACGDTCIARTDTCTKAPGCACNG